MLRTFSRLAVALTLVGLYLTSPALPQAAAADGGPILAYWGGFIDFWSGAIRKQNGVVIAVVLVGLVSVFIITRAKWKK